MTRICRIFKGPSIKSDGVDVDGRTDWYGEVHRSAVRAQLSLRNDMHTPTKIVHGDKQWRTRQNMMHIHTYKHVHR